MATTDILPFGTGTGANVMSQSAYAALSARTAGFSSGTAQSQQLNKVWRQSAFVSAGLANWIVSHSISVPDDGNIAGFVAELEAALTAFIGPFIPSAIPSGSVSAFAGSSAPSGWFECNGAAISRSMHSALFAAIGTTYGAGDGSTTFNLPDLRGEFVRGWDSGRGVDSGRVIGSAQSDLIKAHAHAVPGFGPGGSLAGFSVGDNDNDLTLTTGSTGGTETRPRNVSMMFCIKV